MINSENQNESISERVETNASVEAQIASVPTEFPDLAEAIRRGVPEDDVFKMEEHTGDSVVRRDIRTLSNRFKIEQRLGAINTARENGTISSEVANALELDALRKMREMILNSPGVLMKVPLSAAHEIANKNGLGVDIAISDYENRHPADYKVEF